MFRFRDIDRTDKSRQKLLLDLATGSPGHLLEAEVR